MDIARILTVSMGYGHQRAAFALRHLSGRAPVLADVDAHISTQERAWWQRNRVMYERFSRAASLPIVGNAIFSLMDAFQAIQPLYPVRDERAPTAQLRATYRSIQRGIGRELTDYLQSPQPVVSTFFAPAYALEQHGYVGHIYLQCCDADISRAWAPLDPKRSRIHHFATTPQAAEHLQRYGVPATRIHLTGFPLPRELTGAHGAYLEPDLQKRIARLRSKNGALRVHMFIGGSAGQVTNAETFLTGLREALRKKQVQVRIECGTHTHVAARLTTHLRTLGSISKQAVRIKHYSSLTPYFRECSMALRHADVLWTKPSELSFYATAGIPLILTPPLGAQEVRNREWLYAIGAATDQLDANSASQWLMDMKQNGALERMARHGAEQFLPSVEIIEQLLLAQHATRE